jgi:hypothetical protein
MNALLFLTLMSSQSQSGTDVKMIVAQSHARAIINSVHKSSTTTTLDWGSNDIQNIHNHDSQIDLFAATPRRQSYTDLRERAIRTNLPLIVLVQQQPVYEEAGYLYYYTDHFYNINRPATIISRPINGDLWWISTIENYNPVEIHNILHAPTSTFTPAPPQIQQQYFIPQMNVANISPSPLFNSSPSPRSFGRGICLT